MMTMQKIFQSFFGIKNTLQVLYTKQPGLHGHHGLCFKYRYLKHQDHGPDPGHLSPYLTSYSSKIRSGLSLNALANSSRAFSKEGNT